MELIKEMKMAQREDYRRNCHNTTLLMLTESTDKPEVKAITLVSNDEMVFFVTNVKVWLKHYDNNVYYPNERLGWHDTVRR